MCQLFIAVCSTPGCQFGLIWILFSLPSLFLFSYQQSGRLNLHYSVVLFNQSSFFLEDSNCNKLPLVLVCLFNRRRSIFYVKLSKMPILDGSRWQSTWNPRQTSTICHSKLVQCEIETKQFHLKTNYHLLCNLNSDNITRKKKIHIVNGTIQSEQN